MLDSEQNNPLDQRNIAPGARFYPLNKHLMFLARLMQRRGAKGNAMKRVIAGRFQTLNDANAVAALITRYLDNAEICVVDYTPLDQHDAFDVRGDEYDGPHVDGTFGAHHGQVVPLAAEGINAYSGPLVGAMAEQGVYDDKPRSQERRRIGVTLSVRIMNPQDEERVIATLRAAGAADIVPENRQWRDGDWANFKSCESLRPVARAFQ